MRLFYLYLSLGCILYSSGAFSDGGVDSPSSNRTPWARRRRNLKPTMSPTSILLMQRSATQLEEAPQEVVDQIKAIDSRRKVTVSTSLELPFPADVAFDKFSDLPRQAEFSPWLKNVEYLTPPEPGVPRVGKDLGETKWTMGFRGFRFSWNAISTKLDRPNIIEYESTSGMKNFVFEPQGEAESRITMTMTVVVPRVVAAFFRRSNAMANFVENRILRTTLVNFRQIVWSEDLGNGENDTPWLE